MHTRGRERTADVIDAVVFDLDGVLIDSEPVWEEVRRAYVAEQGGHWQPDSQRKLMGMSTAEWSHYLAESLDVQGRPEDIADAVAARMARRYAAELPLMPHAVAAVRRLAERWPLGLASSSPRPLIDGVLAATALESTFAVIISTEEVGRGKPAPDVYLAAAEGLAIPPDRCAAVEDSSNGLRSAWAAGLVVVAVPHPRYPPDPAALDLADIVLDGLDELTVEALTASGPDPR